MASSLETLAVAVLAAIDAKRDAEEFVVNSFVSERTWIPYTALESLPANGKVWVLGLGMSDSPEQSRNGLVQRELPIQIGVQQLVKPDDTDTIDDLVELGEQIRHMLHHTTVLAGHTLTGPIEPLKDENGTPFGFVAMREQNVFESYFTAYYTAQFK